jgi:hypothetical protein
MVRVQKGRRRYTFFASGRACILVSALLLSRSAWTNEPPEDRLSLAGEVADEDDLDAVPELKGNLTPGLSLPVVSPLADAPPPSGPPAKPPTEVPSLRWEVPPIPWRGVLSLTGNASIPEEGGASQGFSQSFTGSGQSYVWQPWFLKLAANMALGRSEDRSPGSSSNSSNLSLGGAGSLLPGTRYPFSFSGGIAKNSSESRSESGGLSRSDVQTTTVGLSQIYSPLSGAYASSWTYNHLSFGQKSGGDGAPADQGARAQSMSVDIAVPIRTTNPQSLTFSSGYSTTDNQGAGAKSQAGSLAAAHSIYLEDYVLTLSTAVLANLTDVTAVDQRNRSSFSNLTSDLDWVPSDDYPLTIGANAGYFRTQTGVGPDLFDVTSTNIRGTARYPMSKNWNFQGQTSLTQSSTQSLGQKTDNQSVNLLATAGWSGDGILSKWRDWDYSFSYGAGSGVSYSLTKTATDATSTEDASVFLTLGQGLVKAYPFSEGTPIKVNMTQTYGASLSTGDEDVPQTINHAASLAWSSPATAVVRKSLSASVSDGRSLGATRQYFQQASGNALLQADTGPYSTLSGTGAMSYSVQGGPSGSRQVFGANAGARFAHARFANVSGLSYDARYELILREGVGERATLEHNVGQGWSWRFGLLGWRVDHTLSKIGKGGINQSIFVSVVRDFSGVL